MNVEEVYSYEGLYSIIFKDGDKIRVKGLLEEVKNEKRKSWWRVVIGSQEADGRDYVKIYD